MMAALRVSTFQVRDTKVVVTYRQKGLESMCLLCFGRAKLYVTAAVTHELDHV